MRNHAQTEKDYHLAGLRAFRLVDTLCAATARHRGHALSVRGVAGPVYWEVVDRCKAMQDCGWKPGATFRDRIAFAARYIRRQLRAAPIA